MRIGTNGTPLVLSVLRIGWPKTAMQHSDKDVKILGG